MSKTRSNVLKDNVSLCKGIHGTMYLSLRTWGLVHGHGKRHEAQSLNEYSRHPRLRRLSQPTTHDLLSVSLAYIWVCWSYEVFLSSMYMYRVVGNEFLGRKTILLDLRNNLGIQSPHQCLQNPHMTLQGYPWHYVSRSCGLRALNMVNKRDLNMGPYKEASSIGLCI